MQILGIIVEEYDSAGRRGELALQIDENYSQKPLAKKVSFGLDIPSRLATISVRGGAAR